MTNHTRALIVIVFIIIIIRDVSIVRVLSDTQITVWWWPYHVNIIIANFSVSMTATGNVNYSVFGDFNMQLEDSFTTSNSAINFTALWKWAINLVI